MKASFFLKTAAVLVAMTAGVAHQAAYGAATTAAKAGPAAKAKAAPAPKSENAAVDGVAPERKVHHERRGAEELLFVTEGSAGNPAGARLLREAYHLLATADHDYDGHRARAMHNTAEAARLIGVRLRGGGKAGETQETSDEQLRKAQGLLEEALSPLAGRGKVIEHLNTAISQISIALKIR
jgi:hypothetical protein